MKKKRKKNAVLAIIATSLILTGCNATSKEPQKNMPEDNLESQRTQISGEEEKQIISEESQTPISAVEPIDTPLVTNLSTKKEDTVIGIAKAKKAALDHAGVAANKATFTKAEYDMEDGLAVYELEFISGTKEYEYTINAKSGKIISYDVDLIEGIAPSGSSNSEKDKVIGVAKAKKAALDHAGIATDKATFTKAKYDMEDGIAVYELDFISDNKEYEYTINATSGKVLSFDVDLEDDADSSGSSDSIKDKAIGVEKAKTVALTHAGIAADKAKFTKAKYDIEDGIAVYEIEFVSGTKEYEYTIFATSGKIMSYDVDTVDDVDASTNSNSNNKKLIGIEKAKKTALAHAGIAADKAKFTKAKYDKEDGIAVYELEFISGTKEYEYTINATSGKVISYDVDKADVSITSVPSKFISKEKAKQIAMKHAGVTNAKNVSIELDNDDGVDQYEIEFKASGREYSYEVDAVTGKVLKAESEYDDD